MSGKIITNRHIPSIIRFNVKCALYNVNYSSACIFYYKNFIENFKFLVDPCSKSLTTTLRLSRNTKKSVAKVYVINTHGWQHL